MHVRDKADPDAGLSVLREYFPHAKGRCRQYERAVLQERSSPEACVVCDSRHSDPPSLPELCNGLILSGWCIVLTAEIAFPAALQNGLAPVRQESLAVTA